MIYQKDFLNCGDACIRNVISKLYNNTDAYQQINECSNFDLMKKNLEKFGIKADGYEYENPHYLKQLKGQKILLIHKHESTHFINLLHVGKLFVYYFDPEDGYHLTNIKKFNLISTKILLHCYKITQIHYKKISFLKFKEKSMIALLSIFEGLFVVLSLHFIDLNDSYVFTFICLFCLFVISYIYQSFLLTLLKKLQLRIGIPYLEKEHKKEDYINISSFESDIVHYYSSRWTGVISLIVILIITFNIGMSNLLLIVVCLICNLILYLIFKKKKKKINIHLESMETTMVVSKYFLGESYQELIKNGEIYGKYSLFEMYVRIAVICAFCFGEAYLSSNVNIGVIITKIVGLVYITSKTTNYLNFNKEKNPLNELMILKDNIYLCGIYM